MAKKKERVIMGKGPEEIWKEKLKTVFDLPERKTNTAMITAYKLLLAQACSTSQLDRLHKKLPAHWRLPQKFFTSLKEVWQAMQTNPELAFNWQFNPQSGYGFHLFYKKLIDGEREDFFPWGSDRVYRAIDEPGFRLCFEGVPEESVIEFYFQYDLFHSPGHRSFAIFHFGESITEPLTHYLLTNLPLKNSFKSGMFPWVLTIGYELSGISVAELEKLELVEDFSDDALEQIPEDVRNPGKIKLAKPGFTEEMTVRLKEVGVPVKSID